MVKVTVVVREAGKLKPDYSLDFDLPTVPAPGAYISVHRPDKPEPYGEDLIVRQVWWRLDHPETGTVGDSETAKVGTVREIFVECEIALGPYASDDWHRLAESARARGTRVEDFEVARVSFRQRDLR